MFQIFNLLSIRIYDCMVGQRAGRQTQYDLRLPLTYNDHKDDRSKWLHSDLQLPRPVIHSIYKPRALSERKPPPTPKFEPKVIRDSNLGFRINPDPDPDVCRICPKMLWMHYLVGVSHFAKYGTNRPLTVWEILTNVQKSPIPPWWKNEEKKWFGIHTQIRIATIRVLITSRGSLLVHACQV